jgi:5-methyltetrahydrofolate--homocysteine methyltransferase
MTNAKPFCIGFNCALGAPLMHPFLQRLSSMATCNVHAYPNAGLPNEMGGYDETPEMFAENVKKYALEGIVNMIGGCCGTTPDYIKAVKDAVKDIPIRTHIKPKHVTLLSGLTEFIFRENVTFVNIGERCNISGSILFKKMI